ncbi:TRAP transporter small permease [Reinekea marina]|uniref:TRAP transporter small permease protein n=1 Tax=Reinekea marina TaxID=1310421 RepID=A0ABV7WVJ6_9GAMM|nr:TRAP transporter small permease [Reinekea marina]MDN3649671.1 TRAP transporter small permease [Reinekea marina]
MWFLKNFEEVLASLAISVTVLIVILNVVLRYCFGFVIPWTEELSVICFIWATYFGISSCYKHKLHMGVDVVLTLLPERAKPVFRLCVFSLLLVLNTVLAYLSYDYTMLSKKVTPVMGMSYFTINGVLVVCFSLMAFHTLRFMKEEFKLIKHPTSTTPIS